MASVSGLVSPSPLATKRSTGTPFPALTSSRCSSRVRCSASFGIDAEPSSSAPSSTAASAVSATSTAVASSLGDSSSLVPRRCTLTELSFSEDGRLITRPSPSPIAAALPAGRPSQLVELFWATVEASAQVKDLETLTGRLAMIAFFVAIGVEYSTGSGVFSTLDRQGLQDSLGLGLLTAVGGGAFAVALRGKRNVTDILSTGCQRIMDSTVDNLVDALFYAEPAQPHTTTDKTQRS